MPTSVSLLVLVLTLDHTDLDPSPIGDLTQMTSDKGKLGIRPFGLLVVIKYALL